jgi:hypothetical protein
MYSSNALSIPPDSVTTILRLLFAIPDYNVILF